MNLSFVEIDDILDFLTTDNYDQTILMVFNHLLSNYYANLWIDPYKMTVSVQDGQERLIIYIELFPGTESEQIVRVFTEEDEDVSYVLNDRTFEFDGVDYYYEYLCDTLKIIIQEWAFDRMFEEL